MTDKTMLPEDFHRRTPKEQREIKDTTRKMLDLIRKGRDVVMVGVTEKIPFINGTDAGSLHPGPPVYMPWDEFVALRLCPHRSRKVIMLDPGESPVRNAMHYVLRKMQEGN